MRRRQRYFPALFAFLMIPTVAVAAKLQPAALKAWETYIRLTEQRIERELSSTAGFSHQDFMPADEAARVRDALNNGRIYVSRMNTRDKDGGKIGIPNGMVHHWFGSVYIPKTNVESVILWVQNYNRHYRYFKEVEQSKLISREGDTFKIFLRFVRTKAITVRYNTEHTVVYRRHGPGRESSRSWTTRIAEIRDAGTASASEWMPGDDSGYLWRLNSYWRFLQKDNGVIVECESVSLSRSIPFGLAWLIEAYVESVPRESLESTLAGIRDGLKLP